MSLYSRRRTLLKMASAEPPPPSDLLYSLYNQAVSAGDYFSTGVQAFAADVSVTILLDFTLTSRPTSGNAANYRLIYNGTPFQWGTRNTTATDLYYYWFNTAGYINAGVTTTDGARYRICVTHSANSGTVYVKTKKNTGTLQSKSKSATFSASATTLSFGNPNSTNGLPNGTINSAKVYNRVLTSDEINAFFA